MSPRRQGADFPGINTFNLFKIHRRVVLFPARYKTHHDERENEKHRAKEEHGTVTGDVDEEARGEKV